MHRDAAGRVFLDFSPGIFRLLLSHLRVLRDAEPGETVAKPVIPPEHKAEFRSLVRFLELKKIIDGNSECIGPAALDLFTPGQANGVTATQGRLTGGGSGHTVVVGRTPLRMESNGSVHWKVTVHALSGWFYAGVIANHMPDATSYSDPTSFGWASDGQV